MTNNYTFQDLIGSERRRASIKTAARETVFAAALAFAVGTVIGLVWGWLT